MIAVAAGRVPDIAARRWVTQCALSRICGSCAESLSRPIAFLGTPEEVMCNAFHLPPLHVACAAELCRDPAADPLWQVVLTAGFEFVRPGRDDPDQRPRFEP
ncbi:MAG: hypothetical protein ACTHJM_02990, partial [Marmoricola sp.]